MIEESYSGRVLSPIGFAERIQYKVGAASRKLTAQGQHLNHIGFAG